MILLKSNEIDGYLDKNVILTDVDGNTFKGRLTNYVAELDDDDNLIESVDLMPEGASGYYYGFDLKQIKKLELL